eukprot:jgi/Chrzof1/8709/Cz03g21140.t1
MRTKRKQTQTSGRRELAERNLNQPNQANGPCCAKQKLSKRSAASAGPTTVDANIDNSAFPAYPHTDQYIEDLVEKLVLESLPFIKKGELRPRKALKCVVLKLAKQVTSDQFSRLISRVESYKHSPAKSLLLGCLNQAFDKRNHDLGRDQAFHQAQDPLPTKQKTDLFALGFDDTAVWHDQTGY